MVQTIIIGTLLVALLEDDTSARFIVFASALIIAFGVSMLIIFLPKVFAVIFPARKEQVKITLEGTKLVPTVLREPERPENIAAFPLFRFLSRSLLPSKAVEDIILDKVAPEEVRHGNLSKIEESNGERVAYGKTSTPIMLKHPDES